MRQFILTLDTIDILCFLIKISIGKNSSYTYKVRKSMGFIYY